MTYDYHDEDQTLKQKDRIVLLRQAGLAKAVQKLVASRGDWYWSCCVERQKQMDVYEETLKAQSQEPHEMIKFHLVPARPAHLNHLLDYSGLSGYILTHRGVFSGKIHC
jgi:hypothetical protein